MSGNLSNNSSSFSTNPYKMTSFEETRNLSHSYPIHIQNQLNHSAIKTTSSSVDFNKLQMSEDYKGKDTKKRAFDDIWSSIQADKNKLVGSGSGQVPPPYIHPLVRRSTSSLSEKSLEICTESLGSETGSDGFSYPDPDPDPEESDHEQVVEEVKLLSKNDGSNSNVVVEEDGVKFGSSKRSGPLSLGRSPNADMGLRSKSFPPPLSSLAQRDGSNIHIRSHRQHGRLVLEAVSVPSINCFRAHRQDGRLLLTLADDVFEDEEEEVVEESDEEEEEEMIEYDEGMRKNEEHVSSNRLMIDTFTMSKVRTLTSDENSSTWPRTINIAVVKKKEKKSFEKDKKLFRRSINSDGAIMSTAIASTDSKINTYEYYWRQSTIVAVLKSVVGQQITDKAISVAPQDEEREKEKNKLILGHKGKSMSLIQQGVVLVKAERVGARSAIGERVAHDEYLVPLLRGCKEHRMKSFLFLDPYCIVTS